MTFPAPVPEIPAANVDKAAAYYVDTLGFTLTATSFVSSMISGATRPNRSTRTTYQTMPNSAVYDRGLTK
jgi:hypothetical protein